METISQYLLSSCILYSWHPVQLKFPVANTNKTFCLLLVQFECGLQNSSIYCQSQFPLHHLLCSPCTWHSYSYTYTVVSLTIPLPPRLSVRYVYLPPPLTTTHSFPPHSISRYSLLLSFHNSVYRVSQRFVAGETVIKTGLSTIQPLFPLLLLDTGNFIQYFLLSEFFLF